MLAGLVVCATLAVAQMVPQGVMDVALSDVGAIGHTGKGHGDHLDHFDGHFDGHLDHATDDLVDFRVGKHSLLHLHRRLVEFPSVTTHEADVANWLAKYLEHAGLTVELVPVDNETLHDVYAYLGTTRDTPVVLTSHIDTVPPFIPYSVHGHEIHGRGTCDAKGSVAAQVLAFLDLVQRGELREGQAALLFVIGEETYGRGMRAASSKLGVQWDAAIFGEPTENKLGVGHKGILVFDVEVTGKASHLGYPELGLSATEILVPILYELQRLELPHSDLLGPSTINVGRIDAGVALNVVPAHAKASIAIRVAADFDEVVRRVKAVLAVDHVAPFDGYGTVPQYLDYKVPGFESIVLAYTTDVPNLTVPLKQRYLYGPGSIHVAHGDNEYVRDQDLVDAVDGYQRLLKHALA